MPSRGFVYVDDRQLSDVRSVALPDDPNYRTVDGIPHETIRRLFDSGTSSSECTCLRSRRLCELRTS